MTFVLGNKPQNFLIPLRRNSDYVAGIDSSQEPWPSDLSVQLRFIKRDGTASNILWDATVSGSEIRWNIDKTIVNEALDMKPSGVELLYIQGTHTLLWAIGTIVG